jgi:hypothetical protein
MVESGNLELVFGALDLFSGMGGEKDVARRKILIEL